VVSDEITVNASLKFEKAGSKFTMSVTTLKVSVTGKRFVHDRQLIGVTEEAIDLGDIATGGWFFAINQDSTNFVSIRSGTGATNLVKLKAGECAMFRLSGSATAPFAIADTAACDLEYLLIED
jgi:hypothetical protein